MTTKAQCMRIVLRKIVVDELCFYLAIALTVAIAIAHKKVNVERPERKTMQTVGKTNKMLILSNIQTSSFNKKKAIEPNMKTNIKNSRN